MGQRLGRPAGVRNSSDKLVAKPHYSLNELRIPRINLQLLSQSEDVDIHGSRRRHSHVPPHFLQKLLSRQRCSPVLDEVFDQLKLPRRESHWRSVSKNLGAAEIHSDGAELVDCTWPPGRTQSAAQMGFDSGQQFQHVEGFRNVIVGPDLQTQNLIGRLAARAEHHNGYRNALLTQFPANLEAAFPRSRYV